MCDWGRPFTPEKTMSNKTCVITRKPMTNLVGDIKFWTGTRWSFEFPDAKLYTQNGVFQAHILRTALDATVIKDYGLDTQVELS